MSDADTRRLPLRILYTINSSPQYILAREPTPRPITFIPNPTPRDHYHHNTVKTNHNRIDQCTEPSPTYATTSLKACLDTICRSSPELLQDKSRDFSVYVLDPLETRPSSATPSQDPSITGSSGVAVGLGLMSWALLADEPVGAPPGLTNNVTGTIISGVAGQSLEVVFALRETSHIQKSSLQASLNTWGLPPLPSRLPNTKSSASNSSSKTVSKSKSHSSAAPPANPTKPNPSTSTRPTPRPRPEPLRDQTYWASTHPNTYIGPPRKRGRPASEESARAKTIRRRKERELEMEMEKGREKETEHKASEVDENPTEIQSQSQSHPTTTPTLSNPPHHNQLTPPIDPTTANANAALLAALSSINPSTSEANPTTSEKPNPVLISALKVLLAQAQAQAQSPSNPNSIPSISNHPPTSTTKTKDVSNSQPSQPQSTSSDDDIVLLDKENVNPRAFKRKGECEAEGKKMAETPEKNGNVDGDEVETGTRKRRLSQLINEDQNQSQIVLVSAPISTRPNPSSSWHFPTSPIRPVLSTSPIHATAFPLTSVARTSPVKEGETGVLEKRVKRKFVVPEWAKTETALKPRLSEREGSQGQEENEKEGGREKERKRKAGGGRRRKNESRETVDKGIVQMEPHQRHAPKAKLNSVSTQENKPKPKASLPIFASSQESISSCFPSSSPSPVSPPGTPPRRSFVGMSPSGISLFTPTPKSWTGNGVAFGYDSPLFSPCKRVVSAGGAKKGHSIMAQSGVNKDEWSRLEEQEMEDDPEADDDDDGELERELELAMSEGELPVASSDIDVPPDTSFNDDDEEDGATPHWSIGLPPSSPPPVSSPILAAQSDDLDIDQLHSQLGALDSVIDYTTFSEQAYIPSDTASQFSSDAEDAYLAPEGLTMNLDELSTIFAEPFPYLNDQNLNSFGNLFQGDNLHGDDTVVQNGVTDFDFTEFWESVKPLVGADGGTAAAEPSTADSGGQGTDGEVDHAKLAEEVQALFDGCLV